MHHSRTLGVYNTVDILSMCNDYTGATEICTLFLKETHRSGLAVAFYRAFGFIYGRAYERFSIRDC